MVAAIKEICIFVIIAQAIMFFVPDNSYMKYVRVLVGIMMILKITEPILGLFLDEEKEQEIAEQILLLEQNMDLNSDAFEVEDNIMGIYESIEEELKVRLKESGSGYEILAVAITEDNNLLITLADKETEEQGDSVIQIDPVTIGNSTSGNSGTEKKTEKEELKKLFGSCIGVDAERIEIVFK